MKSLAASLSMVFAGAVLVACSQSYAAEDEMAKRAPVPPLHDETVPVESVQEIVTVKEIAEPQEWMLLIHGGAGVISREHMTAERELAFRQGLEKALIAGQAVLASGGTSLDAVEKAVILLEDDPSFNAGRGSVLAANGEHELDASIMDGRDVNVGAVAGLQHVKNPITAARIVMEQSEHVMFSGKPAEKLALEHGAEKVKNSYFTTDRRKLSLEHALKTRVEKRDKRGTVGAVAVDVHGNMAAATSTGGMTAKAPGRVGDSPIVGAGIYADNTSCAVSATGHGEYFIRVAVSKLICDRIALLGESPETASQAALDKVFELGGDGGVIVLSHTGESAFVFNTPGMFRGIASADGKMETRIYGD